MSSTCSVCESPLKPSSGRPRLYCSQACQRTAARERIGRRECGVCGKEFLPYNDRQRFCSRLCGSRFSAPVRVQRVLDDIECPSCKKMFRPRSSTTQYCSRPCYIESCGHRYLAVGGYYRVKVPKGTPGADGNGRMLEHRYVMQESLGRPLRKDEHVHHIDGDRGNNAPENLQLVRSGHGKGQAFVCRSCGSHDVVAVRR